MLAPESGISLVKFPCFIEEASILDKLEAALLEAVTVEWGADSEDSLEEVVKASAVTGIISVDSFLI